jgi:hypothetical protein
MKTRKLNMFSKITASASQHIICREIPDTNTSQDGKNSLPLLLKG